MSTSTSSISIGTLCLNLVSPRLSALITVNLTQRRLVISPIQIWSNHSAFLRIFRIQSYRDMGGPSQSALPYSAAICLRSQSFRMSYFLNRCTTDNLLKAIWSNNSAFSHSDRSKLLTTAVGRQFPSPSTCNAKAMMLKCYTTKPNDRHWFYCNAKAMMLKCHKTKPNDRHWF